MSIIRVKKDKGFFAASNTPFNDKNLSWEARGIMGYLLSKPDNWQVRFYDLVKQGPAGEYKMRRILKELETNKYLERHRVQDREGKFDWVSIVYETPTISRLSTDGLPTDGLPIDGSPTGGKPRDILNTESPNTDDNNKGNNKNPPDLIGGAGFYIFDLVGYDYNKCDAPTRTDIANLINKYGEEQLCDIADYVFEQFPGMGLRSLLAKIKERADSFGSIAKVEHETVREISY